MSDSVLVYKGDALANYGFGDPHPFGFDRHDVFQDELKSAGFDGAVKYGSPRRASVDDLLLFHTADYIDMVSKKSSEGRGYLDDGDTPAMPGIFDAASDVVGTMLAAVDAVMDGTTKRAFVPIAGLHHAGRDHAAGFCVFNDLGVAVEYLRKKYGVQRIAYVDIDAHHGDGVYYGFEDDPDLIFADLHEDGRYLYPGTGSAEETGTGKAKGTKLNIPMPPGATDSDFRAAWAAWKVSSRMPGRSSSCFNAVPTASKVTRLRISVTRNRRTPMRRRHYAGWRTNTAMAGSLAPEGAATAVSISPGPGPVLCSLSPTLTRQ